MTSDADLRLFCPVDRGAASSFLAVTTVEDRRSSVASSIGTADVVPSLGAVSRSVVAAPTTLRRLRRTYGDNLDLWVGLPYHDALRTVVPVGAVRDGVLDAVPAYVRRKVASRVLPDFAGPRLARLMTAWAAADPRTLLASAPSLVVSTAPPEGCSMAARLGALRAPMFIGKGREQFVTILHDTGVIKWHRSQPGQAADLVALVSHINERSPVRVANHALVTVPDVSDAVVDIEVVHGRRPVDAHAIVDLLAELHRDTKLPYGSPMSWELGGRPVRQPVEGTEAWTPASVHGDFGIRNVLVDDGGPVLFDFDLGSTCGPAEVDAAVFLLGDRTATDGTRARYEHVSGLTVGPAATRAAALLLLERWGPGQLRALQRQAAIVGLPMSGS